MKHQPFFLLLICSLISYALHGQTQQDVKGSTVSTDTVAKITVNYTGQTDVVGLAVHSETASKHGIAGYFHGGYIGIIGKSPMGIAIDGRSQSGWGIYGQSNSSTGVYGESVSGTAVYGFSSSGPDIVAGGDVGIFSSDPNLASSDLIISSNNVVAIELDANGGDASTFDIRNDTEKKVFQVDEAGGLYVNPSGDFARLRMSDKTNTNYWDIKAEGTNHENMNFHKSGSGDIMSLSSSGDPLVMSNGAKLTSGGMWMDVSSVYMKTDFQSLDNRDLLEKVSNLPIRQWRYKVEAKGVKHIGPMAQEFYAAFELGESDESIGSADVNGVALAAIQALYENIQKLEEENRLLTKKLSAINELEKRLALLENELSK